MYKKPKKLNDAEVRQQMNELKGVKDRIFADIREHIIALTIESNEALRETWDELPADSYEKEEHNSFLDYAYESYHQPYEYGIDDYAQELYEEKFGLKFRDLIYTSEINLQVGVLYDGTVGSILEETLTQEVTDIIQYETKRICGQLADAWRFINWRDNPLRGV
jgi:hypothetical protein